MLGACLRHRRSSRLAIPACLVRSRFSHPLPAVRRGSISHSCTFRIQDVLGLLCFWFAHPRRLIPTVSYSFPRFALKALELVAPHFRRSQLTGLLPLAISDSSLSCPELKLQNNEQASDIFIDESLRNLTHRGLNQILSHDILFKRFGLSNCASFRAGIPKQAYWRE